MMALFAIQIFAIVVTTIFASYFWKESYIEYKRTKLPLLRKPGKFGQISTSWELFWKGHDMILEGYKKFNTGFQLLPCGRPEIYLCTKEHLEELRNAPEDVLSSSSVINEILEGEYTVPGHFDIIQTEHCRFAKSSLYGARMATLVRTRLGTAAVFENVWDEVQNAFPIELPMEGKEWKSKNTSDLARMVVARASNRLFVGLPLCRNKDYLRLVVDFATTIILAAEVTKRFPKFLKPLICKLIGRTASEIRRAGTYLDPLIEEYEYSKANDNAKATTFLHWFLDSPRPKLDGAGWRSRLIEQMVILNFGSINTSSMHYALCINELADRPEYVDALRKEIEEILREDGGKLTADGLERAWDLDSFVKEVQRVNPQGSVSMSRLVVKPYKFSDGMYVPPGSVVRAAMWPIMRDERYYPNPEVFDGFRFSKLRRSAQNTADPDVQKFSSTSPLFSAFGDGKHACPGRFFASQEIKVMLIYFLLHYDVKLAGAKPGFLRFGLGNFPNPKGRVLVRLRQS